MQQPLRNIMIACGLTAGLTIVPIGNLNVHRTLANSPSPSLAGTPSLVGTTPPIVLNPPAVPRTAPSSSESVTSADATLMPLPTSEPSLTLSPSAVPPGASLSMSGSGFRPGEVAYLYANGSAFALVPVSPNGEFSLQVSVASAAPAGTTTIVAYGLTGDYAAATLTVLSPAGAAPAPSPTPTPPTPPQPTATTPPATPVSTATATPTASPQAPSGSGIPSSGSTPNGCTITPDQAQAEQYLLGLLNAHRAAAGVPPLRLNETLSAASRAHSCDMDQHQQLSHYGSDGSSPFQRIAATGLPYATAGENIGMAGGYGLTGGIDIVDDSMMAEPVGPGIYDHHTNIIDAAYTQVGLGVIYAGGQVWLTEDFIG